ncbi:MAG: cytochrome C [Hydrogenophilales bacterium 12-61-10]|nr:MAG: cytochrome C [Hydrogenophilales bacterium 12-61-10]OYX33362.1 MAG: cytochrome C [Hydrogenophilales bacterium 32-62-9]
MQATIQSIAALLASLVVASAVAAPGGDADIRHGRYLIATSGCNDCHTPGFMPNAGKVAESEWMTGDSMGWQGPWGTTYPTNLRLLVGSMTEQQWLARARQPMRPPMPSPSLQAMTDADLRAIFRYIKSLGPRGEPAPAYVPPGGQVLTPYLDLTPKNLPPVGTQH